MRVLLVSHHAPPHVGGVETLVDLEARALADAGHDVVWATSRPRDYAAERECVDSRVRVVRVPAWQIIERRFQVAYPLFSPRLLATLWREVGSADVVHAHGFVFLISWLALVIARLRGRVGILTDHGGLLQYRSRAATWLLRAAVETLGRQSARAADRLVAYNAKVERLLARLAGTTDKSRFVPNPVDPAMFYPPTTEERRPLRSQLGWPIDRPKVLFAGRIVADKGIELLLAASDPAYDLVFCGPGDPELIARSKAAGCEHLAARPQAELKQIYQAADLLVLPSWNEGFPVVIQEALTCGLPVITSDDPGYEPYRHISGLRFCRLDADSIRQAIAHTLAQPPQVDHSPFPTIDGWLEQLYGGLDLQESVVSSAANDVTEMAVGAAAIADDDVWIVVPAYNEAPRLSATLAGLLPRWRNVVVVDDGSTDDTAAVARSHGAALVRLPINCGQGAALQTGIDFALQRGAAAIVTFDADGQHRASDIPRLLEPLRRGEVDVALGSRFLGSTIDMPVSRRLLLWAAVGFTRLVSRIQVTDTHNGLRALTASAARRIRLTQARMAHASELLSLVRLHDLRYCEVPVTIAYRRETLAKGQSSWGAVRIVGQLILGRLIP